MNDDEDKLGLMLSLQEGVNSIINPQWKEAGQAWHRAIWMECAEMLEREGDWKWWKAPPRFDSEAAHAAHLEQQQIELCDIWHFLLSWALEAGLDQTELMPRSTASDQNRHTAIEAMVEAAITRDLAALPAAFYAACAAFALNFDRLFELYVGKNVVNRFRQDRGYKTGEYRKVFAGLEDNDHLAELMAELGTAVPPLQLADELYTRLAARYDAHVG